MGADRQNGSVFWHCDDQHAWGWMHWALLPVPGDLVQLGEPGDDPEKFTMTPGTYRVLHRKFYQPEHASPRVDIYVEPVDLPVPANLTDVWAALQLMADSAHHVIRPDGSWAASERIKDWFDYDDLELVLRVARAHGWRPPDERDS